MLVDVPEDYTLTQKEHILLHDVLDEKIHRECWGKVLEENDLIFIRSLQNIQRKLTLMDGYLHNVQKSEYPGQTNDESPEAAMLPERGRPPYPTDENGSFEVRKP